MKNNRTTYAILGGLLLLPLAGFLGKWSTERALSQARAEAETEHVKTETALRERREAWAKKYDDKVKGWLEAQRRGQAGLEFWDKGTVAWSGISLYGVTSYEVVDATKG